jgi:hypothetical protein
MTNSASNKAGIPAWFLIVAIGGLGGVVAGALLFFSSSPKVEPEVKKAEPANTTTAAATPAKGSTPAAGGVSSLKNLVTYEDWVAEMNAVKPDSYAGLMDRALRLKDAGLQSRVVEQLLVKWLNAAPENYLQYLDQLESSDDEGKGAWPVLVPAFVKAVPQVGEKAASSPEVEEAVQWMTDYYAEQNPPAALEWAKKWLLGDAQEDAFATIAGQLSKTSLDQAVALARSIKSPNSRVDAMANIGSELGKQDPQKALAWAQALTDPAEKNAAVEEVMWSMSDANPTAAAQQITQLNNPSLLQNVGGSIAESLADKDPQKAVAWAEAVPAGAAQDEALSGALSGWAKSDPKAALAYFQAKHATNYDAAEGIFEQWAAKSPEEAAAQAKQIADAQLREHAITGAVNGWLSGDDVQAVEQWVDQLPAGHEKDVASASVVDALSFTDPQPAWDRAVAIQDAQVRQEAMLAAFSALVQTDRDAAKTALNATNVSAQDRKLLQPVLTASPQLPPPQQ